MQTLNGTKEPVSFVFRFFFFAWFANKHHIEFLFKKKNFFHTQLMTSKESHANTNANRSHIANQYHHNGLLTPTSNYHSSSATTNINNNNLSPYSGHNTINGDHKNTSTGKVNLHQDQLQQQQQQQGTDTNNFDERGRPKTKRNFFGNIKKR